MWDMSSIDLGIWVPLAGCCLGVISKVLVIPGWRAVLLWTRNKMVMEHWDVGKHLRDARGI